MGATNIHLPVQEIPPAPVVSQKRKPRPALERLLLRVLCLCGDYVLSVELLGIESRNNGFPVSDGEVEATLRDLAERVPAQVVMVENAEEGTLKFSITDAGKARNARNAME